MDSPKGEIIEGLKLWLVADIYKVLQKRRILNYIIFILSCKPDYVFLDS